MNKFRYIVVMLCLLVAGGAGAEVKRPAALGGAPEHLGYTQVYDFVDELANMGIINVNSVVKPYDRNQIAAWLVEASLADSLLSVRQRKDLLFYLNDFALECEGMYDGVVQWSNAGEWVNRGLWKSFYQITDNRLQITDYRLQITDSGLQSADYRLQSAGVGQQSLTENLSLRDGLSPTDGTDDTDNSHERFALSLREKRSTDDTDFDAEAAPASLSLFAPVGDGKEGGSASSPQVPVGHPRLSMICPLRGRDNCQQSTVNITPFGRDFCSAQHSTSKLDSAFAYRKNSSLLTPNSSLFSLSLLQPAFFYADEWFECKLNPMIGMDLTTNSHGTVMHRWWGAEIRMDVVDHVAVWGSIRDHSFSGNMLNDEYYASVGQGVGYGARLSQPGFLNNLPGMYYHYMSYGGDFAEVRGGIKAYAWWGSIGLVKDNIQWGDSYHSSNIISNRAPSFPMIELKLKPANWFRLDYIHGFLASGVVDSTYYRVEENPIDGSSHRMYRTAAKYLAANMLTFTPARGLDLSIGSAVVYGARNMAAAFSIPITFFNSMDFQMNSGAMLDNENSQIFFNLSCRSLKYTHFYGSVYIDEIKWARLKPSNPEHNFFSWKVGAKVAGWPVKDLSLTAEFTRTNCGNYQHPYQVLTWASNGYNLGHYLGDNAQEVYLALAYKPVRGLSLTLSYVNATKYNEYRYTRYKASEFMRQKQFDEVVWRNDEVKLHAVYEVVNNAYAFVDVGWNNARGFDLTSEPTVDEVRLTASGYLKRYTPAFYWGENWTVKVGFSFYY